MPVKILLIEDNPDHIMITTKMLQSAGQDYQVDSAMNSKEGLEKLFAQPYDAVLCDYRLPDGTALDILNAMKSRNKDIPFIVATALGSERAAVELMKAGAYDYIVKDTMFNDTLNSVIKKTIDIFRTKKEKERLEQEIIQAYTKLKETQDQLIQAEKLQAVGQLASGVAHEVRNPLGIILQGVEYLQNKVSDKGKEVTETLAMIKESVIRADRIVNALLDFSKPGELDLHPYEIRTVLESLLNLVKISLEIKDINIDLDIKPNLPKVLVDKNKMEQVFVNLLLNAVHAMPTGGKIVIRAYDKRMEEVKTIKGLIEENSFKIGDEVVIVEVEDSGTGILEGNLKKVFDPFFTTKGPKKGSGLGLSVSRSIVSMHKGLIDIKSQQGKGTTVTVTLRTAGGNR